MKTLSSTAIVALTSAAIGLAAILPATAQDLAPPAPSAEQSQPMAPHGGGLRGPGGFLNFDRGAEAVEIALVRLSHRIELTAEQQPLFDAFRTAALAAADDFSNATEALRPQAPAPGETAEAPSFTERLENRIAFERAQLAALEAVQPSATAFFDALSAEQLDMLAPAGGHPGGPRPGFGKHGGPNHHGPRDQAPGAGNNG